MELRYILAQHRMRRRRERSKAIEAVKKGVAVMALAGAALLFTGANSIPTETVSTTYKVEPGDTFWTVAEEYRQKDARDPYIHSFMDELKKLNPELVANGCQLVPGQSLRIEYQR